MSFTTKEDENLTWAGFWIAAVFVIVGVIIGGLVWFLVH